MKKRTSMWLGVLLAVLFLVSTVLTGCTMKSEIAAPAQSVAASPIVSSAVAPAATESFAPGAPQEGIKVHGHWTIEVKNPDGTIAEHREFENALTTSGPGLLASVLGRTYPVGPWTIRLNDVTVTPFMDAGGQQAPGYIVESTYPGSAPNFFKTLTLTVPTSGVNKDKLVLSGSAIAQRDGSIWIVETLLSVGYEHGTGAAFTLKNLSPSVTLVAGQQLTVTVVISFS